MRNIEHIIVSSRWEIEPVFGLQELAKYAHDLDLIQNEVPVDYSAARAALEPEILGAAIGRPGLTSREIPENSIAKLSLSGAMRLEDGLSSRGVRQLVQDIRSADENPRIGAILIEVNSGGGEVTAGTELKNAIDDVRRSGRTKVGVYAQQMASAALRAMLPADFILASSGSALIGSSGTMLTVDKRALEYAKANLIDIYADQSTLKNEGYRALLEGNQGPIRQMLTESNQPFLNEVQEYRILSGTEDQINEVLAGKLFSAEEALDRGLIDGIGTFGQAVERLQSMISKPGNGTFYNKTFNQMKYKSIMAFIAALIPGLNSRLGLELAENATPEDVVDAVNGAKDLETIKAEIKAELASEQDAKITEMNTRLDELTARVEDLQNQNTELTTQRDELTAQVADLTAEQTEWNATRKDLETQVADLTGNRGTVADDGTTETVNSGTPNADQFATVREFQGMVKPTNGSKY